MSATDGKELLRWTADGRFYTVGWAADARSLLLSRAVNSLSECELWQVPLNGASARKIDLKMDHLRSMSAHPDGKRIAFASGGFGGVEVWATDNLVPQAGKK